MTEFQDVIEGIGKAFDEFKADQAARLDDIEKRMNRPGAPGNADTKPRMLKAVDGREYPIIGKGDRLADRKSENADFSIGEFCREQIIGSRKAIGSGPALGRWCNKMSSHPAAPAFVMV